MIRTAALFLLWLALTLVLPSSLPAADNAKLIADGKAKLAEFRETAKKNILDAKQAEIDAATAGEIDAKLPMTFLVTPAGKWKFQKPGHQVSELKRLNAELQKLNEGNLPKAAPALNLFNMKKGDVGRIEVVQVDAFRLKNLKITPIGKDAIVVSGGLEKCVNKDWRFTNTQRAFRVEGIDVANPDYTNDIFVFVGTAKFKGVTMPRLICIERFASPAP